MVLPVHPDVDASSASIRPRRVSVHLVGVPHTVACRAMGYVGDKRFATAEERITEFSAEDCRQRFPHANSCQEQATR